MIPKLDAFELVTGWRRPYPLAVCTDTEALARVEVPTFDLTNIDFQAYVLARLGWSPVVTAGKVTVQAQARFYRMTDEQMRQHPWCTVALSGYHYTPEEVSLQIQCSRITRGHLEDCWALYQKEVREHGQYK